MLTAHIRIDKNQNPEEQSVEDHCLQTAELAAEMGKRINMESLAKMAGLLHDMGKLSDAFNSYIHGDSKYKRGDIDHCFAGAKYLCDLTKDAPELKKTAQLLSRVILSHHGLHDWILGEGEDYFQLRTEKVERYDEICQNAKGLSYFSQCPELLKKSDAEFRAIRNRLKELVVKMGLPKAMHCNRALAFYHGFTERLLTSILIDADRCDSAAFMSGEKQDMPTSTELLWQKMQKNLEEKIGTFANKKDVISLQRKSISERCEAFANHSVSCCKLVVPTGGGKTLSSLRFAVAYCRNEHKEKIFYVAPFLSILEQNSDEIRAIAGDDVFLEHHSDAAYRMLLNDDTEELADYELHAERWDSPVIATTMVQFLNTLFSGKTSSVRRMNKLCNSVIIIDEIQSLPMKCIYLFNLAMNYLSEICGATIVLCSATQPSFEKLQQYPLLIDADFPSMTGDFAEDFEIFRRTKFVNCIKTGGYSYAEAAVFCLEKQHENGSLLAIVNTKAAALEMCEIIKQNTDVCVLHLSTNMCPQHRKDIIAKLRKKLERKENVICVTTQLIEAGVDISFGCVVRSCAGMDHVAQAAGRCNRHGEYDEPRPVYLINLYEEKLKCLPEIEKEKDVTVSMLDYTSDSDQLLNPSMMAEYFNRLYSENKEQLWFPVKTLQTNLLELLSLNEERSKISKRKQPDFSSQAFKTAGEAFSVIDGNTQGILIPYGEGAKKIIAELNETENPAEIYRLMKKAQPYMVNVYPETLSVLANERAIYNLMSGVIALKEEYYNDYFGLSARAEVMEILIL